MKNLITCLVVCVLSSVTFADTWTVDDDGLDFPKADFDNIQEALNAAVDGDDVQVYPGTYYELLTVTGKSLSIIGVAGRDVTIIDAQNSGRVFELGNCDWFSIEGVTIQQGRIIENNEWATHYGGGLFVSNCNFIMRNCSVIKNTLAKTVNNSVEPNLYGGGIAIVGTGTFELNSVYFAGNIASVPNELYGNADGAAIWTNQNNSTITSCRFESNSGSTELILGLHDVLDSCYVNENIGGTYYLYNSVVCGSPGTYIGFGNLFDCTDDGTDGACCAEEFGCQIMTHWDCLQYAMHPRFGGPGSQCDQPECDTYDPFGSCCINGGCGFMRLSACDGIGGQWHGDYVTCEVVSCPQPPSIGACCVIEECIETIELSCSDLNGRWQGELSMCIDVDCSLPTPTGACCTSSTCLLLTQQDCFDALGNYAGDVTACKTTECTSNCLGDVNGDGQVNVNDILLIMSVWGACP